MDAVDVDWMAAAEARLWICATTDAAVVSTVDTLSVSYLPLSVCVLGLVTAVRLLGMRQLVDGRTSGVSTRAERP
jgi:hypothetical protein